ncbi:MAG: AzlD domain-containing protein [Limnochordales bacterium]
MDAEVLLIVAAMAAVTYLPRMVPLVWLSGRDFPPLVMEWLSLLPAALLGALVAQAVFAPGGALDLSWRNPMIVPAVVAGVVAWRRRSLALTVLSGMAVYGAMQVFFGS